MKIRSLKYMIPALAGAAAMAVMGAAPAGATSAVGAGVSTGTVHLNPGVDESPALKCDTQAFTFNGVGIAGAAVSVGNGVFAGLINAGSNADGTGSITGGTDGDLLGNCPIGKEDVRSATGHIDTFHLHQGAPASGTIDGTVTGGTYQRYGPVVLTNLPTSVQLNGGASANATGTVVALFLGTVPGQAPAQDFVFAGPFEIND
jgi:hypothetical protein